MSLYDTLNICSAVLVAALGVVIASVRIPARTLNRHYRTARTYLSGAFILLGLIKMVEALVPKQGDIQLTGCVALIVGAFQALCFTESLLLFIAPARFTSRQVRTQAAVIALVSLALLVMHWLLPEAYVRAAMVVCTLLYAGQLACYTRVFVTAYRNFKREMYDFYREEDLNRQLRWISVTFFSSLAVGCLVLLSLTGVKLLDVVFIVVYTLFYVYLTGSFINYGQYVSMVMRAVMPEAPAAEPQPADPQPADPQPADPQPADPQPARADDGGDDRLPLQADALPAKYALISDRLSKWVDDRKYLRSDAAVKDVAGDLGITPRRLNEYFGEVMGEDFVKWRIMLRLRYACGLIDDNPDRSIQEVAAESGFGDRSYFYRKFAELMGVTVAEYKRQAKSRLASGHANQPGCSGCPD